MQARSSRWELIIDLRDSIMVLLLLIFGLLSGTFLSICIGLVGSDREIGFTWSFLISLLLTPCIGLIAVLLSKRLPTDQRRWGCIVPLIATVTVLMIITFIILLLFSV